MQASTSLPTLTPAGAAPPAADAVDRMRVLNAVLRVEAHLTDIQTSLKGKLKDIGLAADLSSPTNTRTAASPAQALSDSHLALAHENHQLTAQTRTLERALAQAREEGGAWKSLAQNVQAMQALAQTAFVRCNTLERENAELRQAVDAFAAGSPSTTVQELQKIIASLTGELAGYQKREADLKAKESIVRGKENNSIIRAMRKQTRELKVYLSPCHSFFWWWLTVVHSDAQRCRRRMQAARISPSSPSTTSTSDRRITTLTW